MPRFGDVFADVRGGNRTMRVSFHGDQGAIVVSLWAGAVCRGSFRMAVDDVSRLMSTLSEIKLSVDSASTTTPAPRGSTSEAVGRGSGATAVAGGRDPSQPPIDQTGDITGAANRSVLPSAPVLGVA
jgi:hypothetical protein